MIEASRDLGRLQRYKDIIGSLPKPDHQKRATARKLNDLALERERAGSMHEANTLYLEALKADPADVEISNNLGHSLLLVGAPDAARKVLFHTISLRPDRAAAWSDLGRVYADIQDFDRAIACFLNTWQFSRNQERTLTYFAELSQNDDDPNVREALRRTLLEPSLRR